MAELLSSAMKAAPSAGGQAAGAGVTVINVPNRSIAEQTAVEQQALGRKTIINEVLSDLSSGEASKINRMIRTLQR
jgi:hypothetical protein